MKNNSLISFPMIMSVLTSVVILCGCAGTDSKTEYVPIATPTVDYVESLDVYSAPHKDSFLNQLAMNYRSYAIYNARTSGYSEMGELFAQKAVAAFSGELPFPESLDNWPVETEEEAFELYTAYNELLDQLKNDASVTNPELAAEAQAKFDCWLSASASGQTATAKECKSRFQKTMTALKDCNNGKIVKTNVSKATIESESVSEDVQVFVEQNATSGVETQTYYPDTRNLAQMRSASKAREGVIIVNNVNVPEHLINPVPVQPLVFNQNIYGGDKTVTDSNNDNSVRECVKEGDVNCSEIIETPGDNAGTSYAQDQIPMVSEELVTREEFINMMMAMRAELAAINARLDQIQANADADKTIIKVQQIPLEPKQHVMEEVFEIRFDFDKATIKPEYEDLIKQLAMATQNNKNIKVSVVGHTDTMGSSDYNYALGGRRADAVQKMLIKYGIPASQIVAVSAGEEGLAVQTPDGVANAANRRVRVVKEVHYKEPAKPSPIVVEEYSVEEESGVCGMYGCEL